ncbi:MAG: sigma-54-dependent Fis family transcriptional regulator [Acidobacteria bacterium]|nr:sigma-54-dependent Fis family transcriptional regulator [Acidobacteriota bacterium]
MKKVLLIDDDKAACELMSEVFDYHGWQTKTAQTPQQARKLAEEQKFDLIVSDINLDSNYSGLDLLKEFRTSTPVILITAFGSLEVALKAQKEGAWELLSKPFDFEDLIKIADRAVKNKETETQIVKNQPWTDTRILGRSTAMMSLFVQLARVAPSSSTVLIMGESGTGKELVAKAVHENSPRAKSSFVPINCGAITETLLEAELFGHTKGSFTGAVTDRVGLFELANGGTLFLDEIGETSPAMQVKLLRVLQEGEIRRIGSLKPIIVDVRVIAATNRDLETEVKAGRFREDLFYRLSVVTLKVPSLRERASDISLLATKFLENMAKSLKKNFVWSEEALTLMNSYTWPGNVRELENSVESAALHTRGDIVEVDDLPAKIQSTLVNSSKQKPSELETLFSNLPSLDELERRYILYVLNTTGHNRTRAAEILGIDRRSLYRIAERLGFNLNENSPNPNQTN